MSRTAPLLLLVPLVLGGAWLVVRGSHADQAPVPSETAEAPIERAHSALDPVDPADPAAPARYRTEATHADALQTSAAGNLSEKLMLHGTVVVLDERGGEHADESGTIEFSVWSGGPGQHVHAEVSRGQWRVEIARGVRLFPSAALLGGRAAKSIIDQPQSVPADGCIALRMRWPSPLVLRARDAVSGVDLAHIEVVTSRGSPDDGRIVPVQTKMFDVKLEGASPLTIRPEDIAADRYANTLFVRSAGYAWGRVPIDVRVGGDVFVELTAACGLDVDIAAGDDADHFIVCLSKRGDPRRAVEVDLGGRSSAAIDDVPAGAYTVSLHAAAPNLEPLASADIDLVSDARAHVTLVLGPPRAAASKPVHADLSGILVIPKGWNPAHPGIVARQLPKSSNGASAIGPMVEMGSVTSTAACDTYPWQLKAVPVGHYELLSQDPPYTIEVDLLPGGTSDVRIEVPAPADVSVRTIDAFTRVDVPVDQITWTSVRPGSASYGTRIAVNRNPTSGRCEFRCPIGDVEISSLFAAGGYEPASTNAWLRTGPNEVVLQLTRATGLTVILMDQARALPVIDAHAFDIRALDGPGEVHAWSKSADGSGRMFKVTEPGRYSVKLRDPLAGYQPADEQIVDVRAGTIPDVVLRLTRKP